jgi:hypothetical protein
MQAAATQIAIPQHQILADGGYRPKHHDDYIRQAQLLLEDIRTLNSTGKTTHFPKMDKSQLVSKLSEHAKFITQKLPHNPLGDYAFAIAFLEHSQTPEGHDIPAYIDSAANKLVAAHQKGHLPALNAMTDLLATLAKTPKLSHKGSASIDFNPYAATMQTIQKHLSSLNLTKQPASVPTNAQ